VSIKNIVPSEDYARIVAPIINTLKIDSDIMAFTKNKMFQRNLFKDNDVVGKGGPTFFITDNENEDEYDYLMGMDSDEVEIFQYRTKNFPVIAELHLGNNQRKMFTLKPRAIGANHSVIVIPRILSVGNEKIDFISSQTVTNAMYAERKAKGDRSIYDVFGYKRVEETDGTPFLTEDGYYVYKQINLLGDGQLATEHSVYPKRSVINNNTVKVKNEIPDEDIINYFTSKSMASAPRPDVVSFGTEVLPKVLSGEKTTTIRTVYESKAIGIPVGKTIKLNIGGKPFLITNRGIMNIDEAGGKAAMALSEALPTTPDATYKYPIDVDGVKHYAISTDTVGWFNGVGADRYVYDMQLVSPTEQTPTPTAPTQAPLSAKVEVEPNYYTSELLKANPNKIYVFGDNTQRKGTKGQAIIRGVKNAMGIATKFKPDTTEDSYFNDDTISENIGDIDSDIENIKTRLENNPTFTLVFPKDGLGTGLAKLKEKAPQTYAYLKQRLLEEFGFNNDTGEISKPFMAPVSEDVSKPVAGVENIPNSGLTIEQSNQFIDILQPQIVKQAYVENRARTANLMFSFGLRWARNIPNPTEKSEQAKNLGKPRPNKKQIKSKEGATYGYYTTDQNNNPIPSIKELQPIIDFIQSKLGIDMSNYDAMLGNIYDDSSFIHQHRDTTESITAKGYPVIVINLGADGHLEYDKDVSSTYASYKKSGQLNLTNGGIYAFGINGENRFTFHHRIGSGLESPNPLKPIKLPNGETLTNYRITLTFRRASDLEPEMPFTPNKITSTPVSTPVTQPSAPLTLETGRYVKYKEGTYIVTKMNDNGTYQIYNPTLEGASAKISVSAKNLSLLKDKANIVQYKEGEYIVTPKDTIISLTTNKIMKWGEENGDRKSILYLAKGARAFNSAFTEQRAAEILTNYSGKHSLTKEVALTTIADAINKEGQKAIDKLNECY
jgi:alkylated DNA repair dioxygenase AlkB